MTEPVARYHVVEYLMPQDALADAGELRYKVLDSVSNQLSTATYATEKAAQFWAKWKNADNKFRLVNRSSV